MAGIAVAGGGIIYSEKAHGTPDRPEWTAHNGFDESIRDALRFGSKSARDTAHSVSDVLMALFIAEPVIDSFITLGYRDHRWDALWQTSVINMESFTVSALVSGVMEVSTKREKPYVRDCPDGSCIDKDSNRSMPSGHAAFAFTGAGLYCTHHTYQTLYNPATERIICATSLGLAAVDGIARIAADRHYATDVIVGSAIGLFSGFVLPRLLHYAWPDQGADESRSAGGKKQRLVKTIGFSPQILNGGGGLRCDVKF